MRSDAAVVAEQQPAELVLLRYAAGISSWLKQSSAVLLFVCHPLSSALGPTKPQLTSDLRFSRLRADVLA